PRAGARTAGASHQCFRCAPGAAWSAPGGGEACGRTLLRGARVAEAAYNAAVVGPLSRWLKLAGSEAPFRLPLVGPEGGRALFIQDGDLTDLVFGAPLIAALHRTYPRCRISVLVREEASELIRHHPHVQDMLIYQPLRMRLTSPAYLKLARRLRRVGFDMAIH